MRFNKTKSFNVKELLLDRGNYRFIAASNQKECIRKIHDLNPANFRNLMASVAEDDLGELLLVYQTKSRNIVLDGNRRLAVLKVLSDPKTYSPSDSIQKKAIELNKSNAVNLTDIQAQVSSDKNLILSTVYERHAAGKGRSRIDWSAYAAAMFRYQQKTDNGRGWYSIALVVHASENDTKYRNFIESKAYSHEIFNRVFTKALEEGKLSRKIYSDRDKRIKKSADKGLIDDSVNKAHFILDTLMRKELTLSRSGSGAYADKNAVESFVRKLALSPDNLRIEDPSSEEEHEVVDRNESNPTGSTDGMDNPDEGESVGEGGVTIQDNVEVTPQGNGIVRSSKIEKLIGQLGSKKLSSLYYSLCTISLEKHPAMMYVGASCFLESLGKLHGAKDSTSFEAYFNGRLNAQNGDYSFNSRDKRDLKHILNEISKHANINKHSGKYVSATARQLKNDFEQLEEFIALTLEAIISKQ